MWLRTKLVNRKELTYINTDRIDQIEIEKKKKCKYIINLLYSNLDWTIDEVFDSEDDAIGYLGRHMNQRIDLL